MQMAQSFMESVETDHCGKTAVVATHVVVNHIEQIREDLREHAVELAPDRFCVSGFVLGTIVDISVDGSLWMQLPWSTSPVRVPREHVLRILLDDEGEPDMVLGRPKLV